MTPLAVVSECVAAQAEALDAMIRNRKWIRHRPEISYFLLILFRQSGHAIAGARGISNSTAIRHGQLVEDRRDHDPRYDRLLQRLDRAIRKAAKRAGLWVDEALPMDLAADDLLADARRCERQKRPREVLP